MHYEHHSSIETPERELVLREITAIVALRFVAPALYGSMVELGRNYTEPQTLSLDPDTWTAVDDDSVALRRRNVAGYLAAARFGWCPRCFGAVVTYPDGRRLDWPTLDHHGECRDVSDEVQVKPAPQRERRAHGTAPGWQKLGARH
jgi:hypothetical protein